MKTETKHQPSKEDYDHLQENTYVGPKRIVRRQKAQVNNFSESTINTENKKEKIFKFNNSEKQPLELTNRPGLLKIHRNSSRKITEFVTFYSLVGIKEHQSSMGS